MIQFADEAFIEVHAGKGGNGCIAFRREKYIPMGGPSGGDGGKGGDVIFCVRRNLRTLAHLRYHPIFKARNGGDGSGNNMFGRDGEDVVIPVPPGTIIKDAESGEVIREFTTEADEEQFVFLKGGKGGWGNVHFKSSTNQAPRYAHAGKLGEERKLLVELSIMADIGLVGFPNAGKSSLLDFFTAARPKIAPYPFTTKIPNLGVLHVDTDNDIIIADIPGIIEGAADGAGLGIRFLKHISRTAGLIFMIDCSDDNYASAYDTLCKELSSYSEDLLEKPRIILLNKIDVEGAEERAEEIKAAILKESPAAVVLPVSVMMRKGMDKARDVIIKLVTDMNHTHVPGRNHAKSSTSKELPLANSYGENIQDGKSDFLKTRSVDDSMEVQYPGQ
ncbi:MAG: GTPase ObgE [Treponema sp.]|nr:GTPase ObgE [Treponema sp.]